MLQTTTGSAGQILRYWRQRRRLSQSDLSRRARVSSRHLSFVETGRSTPSREMLLHLAHHLDMPLAPCNELLLAAGYAPVYGETRLDDPQMAAVRHAVARLLASHEPYPAVAIDQSWNLVASNRGTTLLLEGVDATLLQPPINVVRLSLHARGMGPRIRNREQWRAHLLTRLRRQVERTGEPALAALLDELLAEGEPAAGMHRYDGVAVPLRIASSAGDLNLLSTVLTFGTPVDVTVADLSLELFFPADDATRRRLEAAPPLDEELLDALHLRVGAG